VAQGEGHEFKPQNLKNKTKQNKTTVHIRHGCRNIKRGTNVLTLEVLIPGQTEAG
jgi:hypothetical protein